MAGQRADGERRRVVAAARRAVAEAATARGEYVSPRPEHNAGHGFGLTLQAGFANAGRVDGACASYGGVGRAAACPVRTRRRAAGGCARSRRTGCTSGSRAEIAAAESTSSGCMLQMTARVGVEGDLRRKWHRGGRGGRGVLQRFVGVKCYSCSWSQRAVRLMKMRRRSAGQANTRGQAR